jgi:hypothetical protein
MFFTLLSTAEPGSLMISVSHMAYTHIISFYMVVFFVSWCCVHLACLCNVIMQKPYNWLKIIHIHITSYKHIWFCHCFCATDNKHQSEGLETGWGIINPKASQVDRFLKSDISLQYPCSVHHSFITLSGYILFYRVQQGNDQLLLLAPLPLLTSPLHHRCSHHHHHNYQFRNRQVSMPDPVNFYYIPKCSINCKSWTFTPSPWESYFLEATD